MKQTNYRQSQTVNQVKIEFTRKPITPWGGVASIVAKFLETIKFREWVENSIPIKEASNNGKGIYEKVIAQFLTTMVGGFRFSHLSWWGNGIEVLMKTFGLEWLPQASSTLTRFWNKVSKQGVAEKMGTSGRSFAKEVIKWESISEDTLNLDSTVLTRYGEQEGAKIGYNPKKPGRPSHHPLIAFLGSGYTVNVWNRAGNASAGQSASDFFEQTRQMLGKGFRVKGALCDSGFYHIEFIEYLEERGFHYIVAVPIWEIFQREIMGIKEWRKVSQGIEVAEFRFKHLDSKWKKERRYVVVRQLVKICPKAKGKQPSLFKELDEWKGYRFSVMITNDERSCPEELWRKYRKRSNDENKIKHLKEGFGLASFNTDNFWATEAVMVMNVLIFHNLIHYLNRTILNVKGPMEQLRTLRSKYFIIPGLLGNCGGYHVLRLSVNNRKLKGKLKYFLEKISLISHRLNCIAVDYG